MLAKMSKKEFLANDTWTAPAGVTRVLLFGVGGGGGGTPGVYGSFEPDSHSGLGGGGNTFAPVCITVVPGTSYAITIGAGGAGGAAVTGTTDNAVSSAGNDTTFGALATFVGAPGSRNNGSKYPTLYIPFCYAISPINASQRRYSQGHGWVSTFIPIVETVLATPSNWEGSTTTAGAYAGPGLNGINDYIGPTGVGGQGGICTITPSASTAGASAAANSGAGGGGGGGDGTVISRAGGNGGSGRLIVMWVE